MIDIAKCGEYGHHPAPLHLDNIQAARLTRHERDFLSPDQHLTQHLFVTLKKRKEVSCLKGGSILQHIGTQHHRHRSTPRIDIYRCRRIQADA